MSGITLHKPQIDHSYKLLNSLYTNGMALDLSECGCGKTITSSFIASEFNSPVVVVCPNNAKRTWAKNLDIVGIKPHAIINYEKLCRGNTPYLNYDLNKFHSTNKWWLSEGLDINFPKNSLVIVDEVQNCKGDQSLNKDMLVKLSNSQYRLLMLSATAASSVTEMKALGYTLGLHFGKNFRKWCKEHGAEYNDNGTLVWDQNNPNAKKGMEVIHNILFDHKQIASRMTRSQFKGYFPECRISTECFDMGDNTSKINQVYDEMYMELDRLDSRTENYSNHLLAIMMKARFKTELLKIPTMVDWVIENYENGISPVLCVNFKDTLYSIEERLRNNSKYGKQIVTIKGNQIDRDQNIDDFQNNKKRICLVIKQAAKDCIDLHDTDGKFPRKTLQNPCWSANNTLQFLGRCDRLNTKSFVDQGFMFALDTIEEQMAERVQLRVENLSILNDGDLSFSPNLIQ